MYTLTYKANAWTLPSVSTTTQLLLFPNARSPSPTVFHFPTEQTQKVVSNPKP